MNNEIVARRLKELRESKQLSHLILSEKLFEKCGIRISDKQLMYYEAAAKDPYHTKADSPSGMSAKNLFALSQFYGVSTDYILGLTDIRNPDATNRYICKYTGLTDESLEILHFNNSINKEDALDEAILMLVDDPSVGQEKYQVKYADAFLIDAINFLIENCTYRGFFEALINYIYSDGITIASIDNAEIESYMGMSDSELKVSLKDRFTKNFVLKNHYINDRTQPVYADSRFMEKVSLLLMENILNSVKNMAISEENNKPTN